MASRTGARRQRRQEARGKEGEAALQLELARFRPDRPGENWCKSALVGRALFESGLRDLPEDRRDQAAVRDTLADRRDAPPLQATALTLNQIACKLKFACEPSIPASGASGI
jgi:hypothetical protein